ncbi:hypothetical protein [Streptomyces bobili]|uniref:hypothetical protein n=1 Tax=Streptomyces bobili TaxID=67280 RepID=UPI003711F854
MFAVVEFVVAQAQEPGEAEQAQVAFGDLFAGAGDGGQPFLTSVFVVFVVEAEGVLEVLATVLGVGGEGDQDVRSALPAGR